MIELARYILAALVAQTHLRSIGQDWMGQIAVFGFYTLSGYLMTRVLNTRYGFEWKGTGRFVLNRVLRLWPAYCVLFGLTLLALRFLPLQNFFFLIRVPRSAAEIVASVTVIGQVGFDFLQGLNLAKPLVTSWSLSIELVAYVLLALYFARSSARLMAFAALGVVLLALSTGYCAFGPHPELYGPYCFQNRYGVAQAGFVPFACGGLFFFHRKGLMYRLLKHRGQILAALTVAVAAMFLGPVLSTTVGPFLGIPLVWMLLTHQEREGDATKAQDFIGRASYHLFIAHMPLAATLVVGLGVPANSYRLYAMTVLGALFLSAFLVPLEWRIQRMRRKVSGVSAAA